MCLPNNFRNFYQSDLLVLFMVRKNSYRLLSSAFLNSTRCNLNLNDFLPISETCKEIHIEKLQVVSKASNTIKYS